jgi:hypothetical protein
VLDLPDVLLPGQILLHINTSKAHGFSQRPRAFVFVQPYRKVRETSFGVRRTSSPRLAGECPAFAWPERPLDVVTCLLSALDVWVKVSNVLVSALVIGLSIWKIREEI